MLFRSLKPVHDHPTLVCFITSYSVVGAVMQSLGKEKKPEVLFWYESRITPVDDQSELVNHMKQSLREVIQSCRTHTSRYTQIKIVLGEPWITSHARTAHVERAHPFMITTQVVNDLMDRELKIFEQEHNFQEEDERGIIETIGPWVAINGYRTDDYKKSEGKTLDVHFVISLARVSLVETIGHVMTDSFHDTPISFVSHDGALIELLKDRSQGTIFAVGGLSTRVIIGTTGFPKWFGALPQGIHTMDRELMNQFEISPRRISWVLSFFTDDSIHPDTHHLYESRIKQSYLAFGKAFSESLEPLRKHFLRFPGPVGFLMPEPYNHITASWFEADVDQSCQEISAEYLPHVHYAAGIIPVPRMALFALIYGLKNE